MVLLPLTNARELRLLLRLLLLELVLVHLQAALRSVDGPRGLRCRELLLRERVRAGARGLPQRRGDVALTRELRALLRECAPGGAASHRGLSGDVLVGRPLHLGLRCGNGGPLPRGRLHQRSLEAG